MQQIKNKKDNWIKAFQTAPLSDAQAREDKTNIARPSYDEVEEGKDWGEFNEK